MSLTSLQQYEFNAKALSASEVAKSFVAPATFERLLTRNNTLLLGPRGSGKTTLLKMLTRKALLNWDPLTLEQFGNRARFHSAFIPADRAWGAQLRAADMSAGGSNVGPSRGEAAFALQTMIGLAVAMRDAVEHQSLPAPLQHLSINLTPSAESQLVLALEKALEVVPPLPTLLGFEIGLRNILLRMGSHHGQAETPFWADTNRLGEAVSIALTIFQSFADSETIHWALLFDELEIAPARVKNMLMENLRGFDQRVVFKLALAPYVREVPSLSSPLSAQVGHDFEVVSLTYPHKQDAHDFSRDLALRVFSRLSLSSNDLNRVLGSSVFQSGRARVSSYIRTTEAGRDPVDTIFRDLAAKDESFAAYTEIKGLGRSSSQLHENQRAALVRKILPSVILRDYFIRQYMPGSSQPSDTPTIFRSRKSSASLYAGYPSLLEVADGNPRTILYLLLPLVDELQTELEHNAGAVIDPSVQARAILRVTYTLVALLRTMPPSWSQSENPRGLMSFIDVIGNALQSRLLRGPFEPEYVGSFILDSNAEDGVVAAIGDALNAGALIHLPDEEGLAESALVGLRGRRFRLSYTLAPRYRLPLTAGQSVSLQHLIGGRRTSFAHNQPSLDLGNST